MRFQFLTLTTNEKSLTIIVFYLFRGQLTKSVLKLLDNNFIGTFVPSNITHPYQPLDLKVNGYVKKFSWKKFTEWYANQIIQQLDEGKKAYDIEVKLRLTMLKPIYAQWLTVLYNTMTSADGKNTVLERWKSAGITETIQKGLSNFPGLGSFSDIDPMINLHTVEPNLEAVTDKTAEDLEMLGVKQSTMMTRIMMTTRKCTKSTVMRFIFLMTILLTRQPICNMLLLNVVFSSFFILLCKKLTLCF